MAKGKIIKGIAGFYYVNGSDGRIYACRAKGGFRRQGMKPMVGDEVEFVITDEEDSEGCVVLILPRKNELIRPPCANLDQALVMFAAAQPEPNLNLLDRFLVLMEEKQVPVKICFNKIDLAEAASWQRYQEIYESAGYEVLPISAKLGSGMEDLRRLLEGKTTILAGPSGVGKSSLTNVLCPGARMEIGSLSEKISRGRHTTRHIELFCIKKDTYLMDAPGFSSLYVNGIEEGRLREYFPEFAAYVPECRFGRDCAHIGEPVCGVKAAFFSGEIAASRYENYKLIYQDLKERKKSY